MASTIIRKCTSQDFNELYELLQQLWPNIELNRDTIKDIYIQKLDSKSDVFFCAEIEGKVIGFLAFSEYFGFSRQGKFGFIGEFVVDKNYRAKGAGTELLNKAIEYAKEIGCKSLELNSSLYRTAAHEFFLKNGFERRAYLFFKKI